MRDEGECAVSAMNAYRPLPVRCSLHTSALYRTKPTRLQQTSVDESAHRFDLPVLVRLQRSVRRSTRLQSPFALNTTPRPSQQKLARKNKKKKAWSLAQWVAIALSMYSHIAFIAENDGILVRSFALCHINFKGEMHEIYKFEHKTTATAHAYKHNGAKKHANLNKWSTDPRGPISIPLYPKAMA